MVISFFLFLLQRIRIEEARNVHTICTSGCPPWREHQNTNAVTSVLCLQANNFLLFINQRCQLQIFTKFVNKNH